MKISLFYVISIYAFSVIPLDEKYEKMLTKLQEAIEDGRMIKDCQAKYKCFGSTTVPDDLNLT